MLTGHVPTNTTNAKGTNPRMARSLYSYANRQMQSDKPAKAVAVRAGSNEWNMKPHSSAQHERYGPDTPLKAIVDRAFGSYWRKACRDERDGQYDEIAAKLFPFGRQPTRLPQACPRRIAQNSQVAQHPRYDGPFQWCVDLVSRARLMCAGIGDRRVGRWTRRQRRDAWQI